MNKLAYRKRPLHVVQCAIPGCGRFGFRTDTCSSCNEYHCEKHVEHVVQGSEMDHEHFGAFVVQDGEKCFPCSNGAIGHIGDDSARAGDDSKTVEARLEALAKELEGSIHRESFLSLMIDKWKRDLLLIDESDESPLERKMWAGMLVRSLDHYYSPQVELFDMSGKYIVRADFASTLLRVAVFTDGETYHSKPADVMRDARQDQELTALGWRVLRYRTKRVQDEFREVLTEVYEATAARCHELHVAAGWL